MTDYNNGYQNQGGQQEPQNQYNAQYPNYNPPQYQAQNGIEPPEGYHQKDRKVAGLLAFFLGPLYNFYMGDSSRGLTQLLISIFTCGIGAIIIYIMCIMEGIKILDGRINTDAYGIFLKD